MALSTTYLAKHTGAEIDAGIDLAQSAVQPAALNSKIAELKNTDAAVSGKYVSAVKQENGVVTVERADLPAAYDDTTLKGKVAANEQAIEQLQEKVESLPTEDTNTTYTFAEGTTDGAFSVTPSGGTAQSVKVHGLKSAAYKDATDFEEAGAADAVKEEIEAELEGYAKDADVIKSVKLGDKAFTKTGNEAAISQADARTALGLGTAAYKAEGDFATAAQGTKADSAVQTIKIGEKNFNVASGNATISADDVAEAIGFDGDDYDKAGAATSAVSTHNSNPAAHADIRKDISDLETRVEEAEEALEALDGFDSDKLAEIGQLVTDVTRMKGKESGWDSAVTKVAAIEEAYIKSVSYVENTGVFTFVLQDGTSKQVDLAIEKVVANFTYSAEKKALILTLADGTTQEVPLSDFITDYTAKAGANQVQVAISIDKEISATLVDGGVTEAKLESTLATKINNASTEAAKVAGLATRLGTAESDITAIKGATGAKYASIKALSDQVVALEAQVEELVTLLSSGEYDIMFVKKGSN